MKNHEDMKHHHDDQGSDCIEMSERKHEEHTDPVHEHEGMSATGPETHAEHKHDQESDDGRKHEGHSNHVDHTGHETMFRDRFWISLVLSIPVLLYSEAVQGWLGFSMPDFAGSEWVTPALSLVVFIIGGVPFLRMAVPEVRNRQPGMMTLISLAISVAFFYSVATLFIDLGAGFFWELVTLIDVMLLGHWLEMRSVRQASGALQELAKLLPDTAERLMEDGSTAQVSVDELQMDDLILVRPGASVPADGIVIKGESDVNESLITGESKPVSKEPDDRVIAGTINGAGSLRVRVDAIGEETVLAGIMRLVEEAEKSKSETQLLADKAASWLFYGAVGVAIITAIAWTLASGLNEQVIARVAAVLVIACPHALGLAIPLVVSITTSIGAKNGMLVRDRIAMEEARQADVVIFDKTGTLTKGEFGVVDTIVEQGWEQAQALALAAAIEGDSEHTIALAIRNNASEHELSLPEVKDFRAIKGRGVEATHSDGKVYVGGPRMLDWLDMEPSERMREFEAKSGERGHSVVFLIVGEDVVASFALADVIRPESRKAVARLQERGIEVAMLTGDSADVAQSVANDLGIDQYSAQVLPQDKDKIVEEFQREGKFVAMVGDGVNDAPALTRADVGIAIGSGTDVAIESADVILVSDDPWGVVKVVELSRASYRKMVENLIWATGYNVVAVPLAAGILAPLGILLSPAIGALFMSLSTVLVAINAQTLRRADIQDGQLAST